MAVKKKATARKKKAARKKSPSKTKLSDLTGTKPVKVHPGRPSKYKPEYCDRVIQLGAEGMSQVQIAVELGVGRTTMLSWCDQHSEFKEALSFAKDLEQAFWEQIGKDALYADKFQYGVWKKSMESRFKQDYTERQEVSGPDGRPIQQEVVFKVRFVDAGHEGD